MAKAKPTKKPAKKATKPAAKKPAKKADKTAKAKPAAKTAKATKAKEKASAAKAKAVTKAKTDASKTALEKKLDKKAKEAAKAKKSAKPVKGESAAVVTESRTGKTKLPSILTSSAFLEMTKHIDAEEKKLGVERALLTVGGHIENAISTGVLVHDFVSGGGYAPGRFTVNPGEESSGKTTMQVTSIAQSVQQNVPVYVADAEAAFDAGYADRALDRFGYSMSQMQGVYDPKKKLWVEPPMVRIAQDNNGEKVFRLFRRIMKAMPTIKRDYDGNWWAVTVDDKTKKEVSAVEYSGLPQMMFFIDSLAALIPNILDDDDEKETIGAQALMFSRMLPKVAALMTLKHCIVVGSNQLRTKIGGFSRPGAPPPTEQPGGKALKFYTDIRTGINSCASSTAGWHKTTESYYEEKSIYGGIDRYAFTCFRNMKNKVFMPKRVGYARIRFMKDGAPGDGYCETFDALEYLRMTGQLTRRGNTLSLDIQGATRKKDAPANFPVDPHGAKINFMDFKIAVEDPRNKHAIWNHCRSQIKTGFAFALERERMTNNKTVAATEDDG